MLIRGIIDKTGILEGIKTIIIFFNEQKNNAKINAIEKRK